MRALNCSPEEIVRIQGPTFSGSFYSLSRLIQADKKWSGHVGYVVRSGTATSKNDVEAFRRLTGADYKSATTNSREEESLFREAIKQLQIKPSEAAVLVEDETAFGDAVSATTNDNTTENNTVTDKNIRVYRYPRDISHLRNAYREALKAAKANGPPNPDITFSLKDPGSGEDSVPSFSASQGPLSQDAILAAIAETIRRHNYKVVLISATNTLDLVFVAQVLRKQCPDVRVVISNAHRLFIEASQTQSLVGLLALSTYPLFELREPKVSKPIHSDSNSEGVYNATILLLKADSALLSDYTWQRPDDKEIFSHPPLWFLTLDRNGWLPVSRFVVNSDFEDATELEPLPLIWAPPRVWWLVALSLALGSILVGVLIIYLSCDQTFRIGARFDIGANDTGWRKAFLVLFLLSLSWIQLVMWLPVGWLPSGDKLSSEAIILLGIAVPIVIALVVLGKAVKTLSAGNSFDSWRRVIAIGSMFVVWLIAVSLWAYCCFWGPDHGEFFRLRARELRLGSSPIWPVEMAGLALLAGSFIHLTRPYISAYKPATAADDSFTSLGGRLWLSYQEFGDCSDSLNGLWKKSRSTQLCLSGSRVWWCFTSLTGRRP
jgi:hypothetical protein